MFIIIKMALETTDVFREDYSEAAPFSLNE